MHREFNVANLLSLLRAPLAFVYLVGSIEWKVFALVSTALSDFFDGYLARRYHLETKLGACLDPAMDKFFILCVSGALLFDAKLTGLHFLFFICRDLFLLCIVAYLLMFDLWKKTHIQPAWFGKLTTGMQLLALLLLTVGYQLPDFVFYGFLGLAICTTMELLFFMQKRGELKR